MDELIKTRIESLIRKYYPENGPAFNYYYTHVQAVANLALKVADMNPHLNADPMIVWQMAMVHDIGIRFTNAPEIGCNGTLRYIEHGYKGREVMEAEGFPDIAPVCERHIGVGITREEVLTFGLPLPRRDMVPTTIEEEMVCYADKFFSKSADDPAKPKPIEKIEKSLKKYGDHKVEVFRRMMNRYGTHYIYKNR